VWSLRSSSFLFWLSKKEPGPGFETDSGVKNLIVILGCVVLCGWAGGGGVVGGVGVLGGGEGGGGWGWGGWGGGGVVFVA